MNVVIIDYGAGNVQSVINALNRIGIEPKLSGNAEDISAADKIIFPGVGHAQHAMQQLQSKNLDVLIPKLGQPVLGICLGMQLMCSFSEEGNTKCLGIFDETVKLFSPGLKVPHIGWNETIDIATQEKEYFYFVHSYYVPLNQFTTLSCNYGIDFSAAMQKENFYAVQFHPEKSADAGELLLKNFILP